ncbi:DUF2157 domain-containing protein [Anabaena sp. UHCC 0451]|uniref:DUF2157 domain-containing protein n=1 Tax=Anabaena sp. UHCC 0451 TaxID=2055235 RepID=UPI002B1F19D8|nr:DUF2157 domain-containing protein [Anabaena sp. UHCC 0451]MEA5579510.1 DUF2157 domain-containing protein [Anabaena sp. UHCC 0451]
MILDNFVRKLRQEAQLWRDEGLISSSQHQQLADRYQFNKIEAAAKESSGLITIAVGGLLLILGVIIFVAANWQTWSREVKFILLMSFFLSTAITGFLTWREPTLSNAASKKQQRSKRLLGEALLILSALILGATLMLMAQIFNISGSASQLFLAWGFGVLVMAYSLSLNSLGILAIILLQIGYWFGLREFWSASNDLNWARLVVRHTPLISWLLFVPLAYICRSRVIFVLAAIAFTLSLQYNLNPLPLLTFSDVIPWVASFALALPPALFWSYDDLLFPNINYRLFQPIARNLALVCFAVVFYLLSFRWQWQALSYSYGNSPNNFSTVFQSLPIIDLGILSGLAVLQWLFLFRHRHPNQKEAFFTVTVISIFLSFIVIVPFWHQAIGRITELGIFVFNVLLITLAWGLIQEGLKLSNRLYFWCGMLLFILQIISRVLEYDTDLLFRSLVFVLCGSGLISAGLWFERRLNERPAAKKQ